MEAVRMANRRPGVWLRHPGCDEATATQVVEPLRRAGYAVWAGDAAPGEPYAVLVQLVADAPEAAAAFTRRTRADGTHAPKPILWLLTEATLTHAATGLDAGAEACLVHPVDGDLLCAQVNALLRTQQQLSRFAAQGDGASDLTARLQKAFRTAETEAALAQAIQTVCRPPVVPHPGVRVAWHSAPTLHGGASSFDIMRLPDGALAWVLVDAGGCGPVAGGLLTQVIRAELLRNIAMLEPGAALTLVNERLRTLPLSERTMLSAAVGKLRDTGVSLASAALPAPLCKPRDGDVRAWHGSGPFLGSTSTIYGTLTGELPAGTRLVLLGGPASADCRPDVREWLNAVEQHQTPEECVQMLAQKIATRPGTDAADGLTVLLLEGAR